MFCIGRVNFIKLNQLPPSTSSTTHTMESTPLLTFGKHTGKEFEHIRRTDISYCNWALKQAGARGIMKTFQDWLKARAHKVSCEACNGTGIGHTM